MRFLIILLFLSFGLNASCQDSENSILLETAWGQFAVEQYSSALEALTAVLKNNNQEIEAYVLRGLCYVKLAGLEQDKADREKDATQYFKLAIKDYDHLIKEYPDFEDFYIGRAFAYSAMSKHWKAVADYSKAIELDPYDINAYYNRGLGFIELQSYDQAIDNFDKSLELNSEDADCYFNRAFAMENKGEYGKAIADYSKAIELDPSISDYYFYRAFSMERTGQLENAVADYTKVLEFDDQNSEAYFNRGLTYIAMLDKTNEACDDFRKAEALHLDRATYLISAHCE